MMAEEITLEDIKKEVDKQCRYGFRAMKQKKKLSETHVILIDGKRVSTYKGKSAWASKAAANQAVSYYLKDRVRAVETNLFPPRFPMTAQQVDEQMNIRSKIRPAVKQEIEHWIENHVAVISEQDYLDMMSKVKNGK
jgi:hypothetical protein